MATVILGTLGSVFAGPIGGMVGSALGSLIDNAIFAANAPAIKGPRLSELRLPTFDEGSPAPWLQGPTSRVSGQVIWLGSKAGPNKVEERKNTSGGGKGGGKPKTVTYDYYASIAIAFARQSVSPSADTDGKYRPLRKLWANGQLIYDADKANTLSSSNVKVIKNTKNATYDARYCTNKAYQEEIIYEHQGSATAFQDAGFKAVTNQVTVAGFANAVNNGTYTIVRVETVSGKSRLVVLRCEHKYKSGGTYFAPTCTDTSTCVPAVNENAGAAVTFTQPLDAYDKGLLDEVRQYCGGKDQDGTAPQTADATIVAVEGTGNVPAYRNTVYVVVKNLKITNWGGSIPTFEGLVRESNTRTVGEALVNVATRNGALTSSDVDVSEVTGNLMGLVMMGPKDPRSILALLMSVYDLEVQERASIESGVFKNKLVFVPKASSDLREIVDEDRGANVPDGDTEGKDVIGVEQTDPDQLPSSVVVQFMDPDEDYQPGATTYRRAGAQTESQNTLSLPMALTQSNALALAKKLMWQWQTNGRRRISLTLPPTYIDLAEADRISVSDADGLALRGRVVKVDRGANGLLMVEALEEVESVYSEPTSGETRPGE